MNISSRYTLSYHYFGQKDTRNHIDLFLEIPQQKKLIQIRIEPKMISNKRCTGTLGSLHRSVYMEFQGNIANNRGKVRILKRGKYRTGLWILKKDLPINIKIACQ
ncbi:MAG: hypothetical protein ABUK01_07385 [Leptospirales bacterium]